jgi:hypothetical protein
VADLVEESIVTSVPTRASVGEKPRGLTTDTLYCPGGKLSKLYFPFLSVFVVVTALPSTSTTGDPSTFRMLKVTFDIPFSDES